MLTAQLMALALLAEAAQADASTLFDKALVAFGSAALAVLTWALKQLADYVAAKVKNAKWAGMISRVDDLGIRVVREVEATYVAELELANKDGVITAEEKAGAKAKALEVLKSYLGAKGLGELAKLLGADSIDSFLAASIEHALANHDNAEALAAGPRPSSNAA
jgi:hypothetical protein